MPPRPIFYSVGAETGSLDGGGPAGIGPALEDAEQKIAPCPHCWRYESMAVQINIRDELAARAVLQG